MEKDLIKKIIKQPSFILVSLSRKFQIGINDELYLKILYKSKFNKKLNLENPKTFNEKIQWLKLHDRKDIYTTMVDKAEAKKYVADIIGDEYIIPTIGVYDKFEDIDFEKLPNQFVIKCTHDTASLVICKNKSKLDIKKTEKKIKKCLKRNYFYSGREWPYKNVKPRIIIEKYMEDEKNKSIMDYKFFCFDGKAKCLYISEGSHTKEQKLAFFDINFEYLDIKRKDYKDYDVLPEKPKTFELMKQFAEKLSKGIPHLRVDFYEINGKLFFGELTLYTGSGFIPLVSEEWGEKLGDMINIEDLKKNIK